MNAQEIEEISNPIGSSLIDPIKKVPATGRQNRKLGISTCRNPCAFMLVILESDSGYIGEC